jgi:DNA replication protein DnaC
MEHERPNEPASVPASASAADAAAIGQLLSARRAEFATDPAQPSAEQTERERRRQERQANADRLRRELAIQQEGQRLRRQAGERYVGCRLENFRAETAYQKRIVRDLSEYAKSIEERCRKPEGLVLFGPVGTGKDHLAYAMAASAVLAGLSVGWLNGQDWFGQIRDAIDDETRESTLIGRIAKPDLVVISDPLPPVGQLTQHQAAMLYRAVEARYSRNKATIVTVNVADDSEADHRLGAPTWDRLCHGAWKVFCNWPSFRRPAREIKP